MQDLLEDLFYDFAVFLLKRFAPIFCLIPFRKICFIYFRKFALFILESLLLGVALCNLEIFFS